MLRRLVEAEGASNWHRKKPYFGLHRTGSSLRHRWIALQKGETGSAILPAQDINDDYDSIAFPQIVVDMPLEVRSSGGGDTGAVVWYPAFVKAVEEDEVLLYYPETEEEEYVKATNITAGSLRKKKMAPSPSAKVTPPYTKEEYDRDMKVETEALAAIKWVQRASRAPLKSALHESMYRVWDAVRYVGDGYKRHRAAGLLKLPPRASNPDYLTIVDKPIHLEKIRKKIVQLKYIDMDSFEEDMTLVFENARQYFENDHPTHKDAEILQNVFWEAFQEIERGGKYKLDETPGDFVKPPRLKNIVDFTVPAVDKDMPAAALVPAVIVAAATPAGAASKAQLVAKVKAEPEIKAEFEKETLEVTLMRAWDKVVNAKEKKRQRAELFMELPERVEMEQPVFPPPLTKPPVVDRPGRADKMENGELPNMSKKLPEEAELRKWNRASQEAFWSQRRAFWNRLKLSDMQRESRKRGLWPGGEGLSLKDRLIRYDYCRSTLSDWETRTEEQDSEERSQIGVLYYEIIKEPIDLNTIRANIDSEEYSDMKEFEADMKLLFNNARRFDKEVNLPEDQAFLSRDADALQELLKHSLKGSVLTAAQDGGGGGGPAQKSRLASVDRPGKSAKRASTEKPARPSSKHESLHMKESEPLTQVQLMEAAFNAVRGARDGKRERALLFLELPSEKKNPEYYEVVKRPIDLATIQNRFQERKYKSWQQFVRNFQLCVNTGSYSPRLLQCCHCSYPCSSPQFHCSFFHAYHRVSLR